MSPSPTMATGPARSPMRVGPIELARLAIKRPGLQGAITDTVDRHYLGIVPGGKYLVGILHVAIAQGRFDHAHTSITQELDHTLAGDAVEERAVWRRREHRAILADEDVCGGKLGHVAEQIEHHAIPKAARVRLKQSARIVGIEAARLGVDWHAFQARLAVGRQRDGEAF